MRGQDGSGEREQRIRELAHHIWEAEGCPSGQEQRHWYAATRLVEAEDSGGHEDGAA
ncbi:DUF2934 domain-containing protein [Dyella sp. BiH032]|uniref:DUF2934 domain-containing protein n=1 Tax=Dyella sp. BiH032 TaxID=3075430 RepID=UPI00289352C7|nr:DUF2934 domain-containing protein [Dyella sp. BiH032]WNL48246.1 DUF2934 domain-containing protein [Dyella sp. BiH032]